MALPGSGALSLNQIAGEFGGTTPHSLSEYYRGGGLVPSHVAGVPTSGTIGIAAFYSKSKTYIFTETVGTMNNYNLRARMLAHSTPWDGVSPVQATVTISGGAVIYSTPLDAWAFKIGGSLPAGSSVLVINYGYIVGSGAQGAGGSGVNTSNGVIIGSAANPTHGLLADWYMSVQNYGWIAGGGGWGGGGGSAYRAPLYFPGDGKSQPNTYPGYRVGGGGGGRGAGYGYYGASPGGTAQWSTDYNVANGGSGGVGGSVADAGGGGGGGLFTNIIQGGTGGTGGSLGGNGATGGQALGSGNVNLTPTSGGAPGYAYGRNNADYLSINPWGNVAGQTY